MVLIQKGNGMQRILSIMMVLFITLLLAACSKPSSTFTFFKSRRVGTARVKPVSRVSKPTRHNVTPVGRYSSISNAATTAQKNPLLAISQFKFGTRVKTVGQALWQVLLDTGYALVPEKQLPRSVRDVLTKPLPVTQRELGPISISNALRTLMDDRVFTLVVDPVHRLVTFTLKSTFSRLKGAN